MLAKEQPGSGAASLNEILWLAGMTFWIAVCIGLMTLGPVAMAQATLSYASHVGGDGDDEIGSIAIAPNGDRVFCGNTESADLATIGAIQTSPAGGSEIIVGRYAADDKSLLWLTYFGGAGEESCTRIATDRLGDIIIVGRTTSADFPAINAADGTYAGGGLPGTWLEGDAFVTKLSGDGESVVFSTYLGGFDSDQLQLAGRETIRGLFIDGSDRIVVAGSTGAPDFPATRVLGEGQCGVDGEFGFVGDQFVARYRPDGSQDFAVCISASARDAGRDVTLDDSGLIYLAGFTQSSDYPATEPAIGPGNVEPGYRDGAIMILDPDATEILRAVTIGGENNDHIQNIRIDSAGRVVIQGTTSSTDFPTTPDAWQPDAVQPETEAGDVVVSVLSAPLDELLSSTFVGGGYQEYGVALALDNDQPVLQLRTRSRGLPAVDAIQWEKAGDLIGFSPFDSGSVAAMAQFEVVAGFGLFYGVGVVGPGVNRLYEYNEETDAFDLWLELSGGPADSRDIVFEDVNGDNKPDILVANHASPNLLYLATGDGNQFAAPVEFGDAAAETTALWVIPTQFGACVIDLLEDAPNVQYEFAEATSTFDAGQPYGEAATASRDVAGFRDEFVEISAPDQLTWYEGCAQSGVSPIVRSLSFPGRDFVAATRGNLGGDSGGNIIVADRNGGGVRLPGALTSGYDGSFTSFEGPPTNAIAIVPGHGVITAHDKVYRYYRPSESAELVLDSEQPALSPANVLLVSYFTSRPQPLAGTPDGLSRGEVQRDSEDLYMVRLTPDLASANFATYLGGPGEDLESYGANVIGPGQYVFGGSTQSTGFPVTTDAVQSANAGQLDGVLIELDIGTSDPDTDEDGVADSLDNCTLVTNPDQRDTNGDGFGNVCDPDLNNDNIVNFSDLGLLRVAFFTAPGAPNWNPDADFNGDDIVNFSDLGVLRAFFFGPPGPAAKATAR